MGNRAMIVLEEGKGQEMRRGPAIYAHWNGGPESVYAFLQELDNRQMRVSNVDYETARLVHVIGDYFDHENITTLSLGINNFDGKDFKSIDVGDNGTYLVNRQLKTVKRYINGKAKSQKFVDDEKAKAIQDAKYAAILEVLAKDRTGKKIQE